jgi:glutamate synthase domain-containing protein 2
VSVLKQALTDQGFDPEDVETEVERLKNYGDLESVAAKHHKVLVKKEAAKLAQMEQQKEVELQKQHAYKQQYVSNVQSVLQDKVKAKEFDGIPINPKLANELQDFLLVDKYQTSSGEKLTEFDRQILELKRPENHAQKVKLGLLLKILETDPTLSTIQKRGISKKSDDLFSEVARQTSKTGTKGKSSTPTSWFQ